MLSQHLAAYLPMDRYQALALGVDLPERATGAVLFADISGFTPLAETLVRAFGARRGGEALAGYLNTVYDALIAQVHAYHGSVIGFSGDAISCWFGAEGERIVAHRAVSAALAMQEAMALVARIDTPTGEHLTLALKVAVVAGPVRRLVVGDPLVQRLDVLAGATLDRLARAEHLARAGDVLVGGEIVAHLTGVLEVRDWLGEEAGGESFALARALSECAPEQPWPPGAPAARLEDQFRSWVLPRVYERLVAGGGDFLTELRPAVALFLRFGGRQYDDDPAVGGALDAFVRWVQGVVSAYEGTLVQLTIGDKGSYLYCAFGAPIAHQNDAERAVRVGRELLAPPPELEWVRGLGIGVSMGAMRCGAYGGSSRHTYGVLGDETNLAARLMQATGEGELLATERVREASGALFGWGRLPALTVKGKTAPVPVYRLAMTAIDGRERRDRPIQLNEPTYTLPLIGRAAELALVRAKLALATAGQGQIVAISGEAGLGKSRLVAEVIRLATEPEPDRPALLGYGGECHSYATNTPYLVWRPIVRGLLGLDAGAPADVQVAQLERALQAIDPALPARLPLLGVVLNLPISDTALTRSLDEQLKKASREALILDLVRARAQGAPLLLVLEDCHWLDPLSHDLLEVVGRAVAGARVLIVLAYRPPELEHLQAPRVTRMAHCTSISLNTLSDAEAARVVSAKMGGAPIGSAAMARLVARADGNPFYLEELVNYLLDQHVRLESEEALTAVELPDSLHRLVLSRLDRLSAPEQMVLKVASVIGRVFAAAWVWGVYPALGDPAAIRGHLEHLSVLDITPLDQPEPEPAYLFKHAITQEAAYESQPLAARTRLHEAVGQYIEGRYSSETERWLDLLAYHYGRSANRDKQREYFRRAGAAAKGNFANAAALIYYEQLLGILEEPEQVAVLHEVTQIRLLIGEWERAEGHALRALSLAERYGNRAGQARGMQLLGQLKRGQGAYVEALDWLARARASWEALVTDDKAATDGTGDAARTGLVEVLGLVGDVCWFQGALEQQRKVLEESLVLARALNATRGIAKNLNSLGLGAMRQGEYAEAVRYLDESLVLNRRIGDKHGIANSLANLGTVVHRQGNVEAATRYAQESLDLRREIGDKRGIAGSLGHLMTIAGEQGDLAEAMRYGQETLTICEEVGDLRGIAVSVSNLGVVAALRGDPEATRYYQQALTLYRDVGDRSGEAHVLGNLGEVAAGLGDHPAALRYYQDSLGLYRHLGDKRGIAHILMTLAVEAAAQAEYGLAVSYCQESLDMARIAGDRLKIADSLHVLGVVATLQGEYPRAGRCYRESLTMRAELGDRRGIAATLGGLAALACIDDSPEAWPVPAARRAARLVGATETLLAQTGSALEALDRGLYERATRASRVALGDEEYVAARAAGQALSLEEAIRFADWERRKAALEAENRRLSGEHG